MLSKIEKEFQKKKKNWGSQFGKFGFCSQHYKLQGKEGLLKTFFENLKLFIHFLENYNVILQSNLPTFNVMGSLKFYLGEKTVKCNY